MTISPRRLLTEAARVLPASRLSLADLPALNPLIRYGPTLTGLGLAAARRADTQPVHQRCWVTGWMVRVPCARSSSIGSAPLWRYLPG